MTDKINTQNFTENVSQENFKKEILIAGVDVSGCKDIYCGTNCNNTGASCPDIDCANNPNCYFKQLKHKEQEYERLIRDYLKQNEWLQQRAKECEELKYKNSALEDELNVIQHNCNREGCKYFDNGEFKVFYICKAKQILDKIEKLANKAINGELTTEGTFYTEGMKTLANYVLGIVTQQKNTQQIIDKVNEVSNDK